MRYADLLLEAVTTKPLVLYHGTKSAPFDAFAPQNAAKGSQHWNPLGNGMYASDSRRFAAQFGTSVHKVLIPAGAKYRRIGMREWYSTGWSLAMKALKLAMRQCGESFDAWENGAKQPDTRPNPKTLSREQLIDVLIDHHAKWGRSAEDIRNAANGKSDDQLRMYVKNIFKEQQPGRLRDADKDRAIMHIKTEISCQLRQQSPYESLCEIAAAVEQDFGAKIGQAFTDALPVLADAHFRSYDFVIFTETNDVIKSSARDPVL